MHVAIVSDTHLPRFGRSLPPALVRGISEARVDRILHAGDWTQPLAFELLEALAPVDGVAGNNDGPELHERFGTRRVVTIDGCRFGITHGHLGPGRTTPERAVRAFAADAVDAVVFGHSHVPLVRALAPTAGGAPRAWLVNPGSPTDRRRQPAFSWALAVVERGAIRSVELVTYADRGPVRGRGAATAPSRRGAR